jgi:hypothetical protein
VSKEAVLNAVIDPETGQYVGTISFGDYTVACRIPSAAIDYGSVMPQLDKSTVGNGAPRKWWDVLGTQFSISVVQGPLPSTRVRRQHREFPMRKSGASIYDAVTALRAELYSTSRLHAQFADSVEFKAAVKALCDSCVEFSAATDYVELQCDF